MTNVIVLGMIGSPLLNILNKNPSIFLASQINPKMKNMKICKCDFDLMVSLSMDYILSKVYINFPIFLKKKII